METDETPLERIQQVLDELTATSIVAHTHPYYHGFQFEGEWLDRWKERLMAAVGEVARDAGAQAD